MPSVATRAVAGVAGVAQWLELQAVGVEPHLEAEDHQEPTVTGNQVRHGAPHPHVPVQPEPALHRVRESVTALFELAPSGHNFRDDGRGAYWQPISPSTVAGGTAATLPK